MPPPLLKRVDDFAEQNAIGRSEAVRRLAEKGLNCQESGGSP
jgi:metal-responsive CopG/Arc/MetJ family transcriptional regulator